MRSPETSTGTIEKAPSQGRALGTLTWYSIKAQARSPSTLIFGVLFPLVFITIFGLIGDRVSKVKLGMAGEATERSALAQVLREHPAVTLITGEEQLLEQQLRSGKLDSIVKLEQAVTVEGELPFHRGKVVLRYSAANPQAAAIARSFVDSIVARLNLKEARIEQLPYQFEAVAVEARHFGYVDFVLPGQLGFSLLSAAIFGTAFALVFLKRSMVIKRIAVTPTRPLTVLCSQALARVFTSVIQVMIIVSVGVYFFNFHLARGWMTFLEMVVLSVFGLVAFLGLGFLIAARARNMEAVSPMANLLTMPQFLLSGTFFSTEGFPLWLQAIADHLPLTYFNVAMRKVASEGAGLREISSSLVGLALWGLGSYILAARSFRWS